ncbi:MAG: cytochrome c biogenesis protein CcsA [Planctomycetota bacterium]|jgi:ABC-type uncharacterized transport system permease subunit|nr:cytochrome c biogenesis protein CcsA [Planctomycetota bacterium]MDP7133948.1 cytochrome c biogenesis protein CcsA [Planctomycetota bacterium]MDP7250690.1 cytochrome c biogenesis protein CcsA [Planctomycetota bacterium]
MFALATLLYLIGGVIALRDLMGEKQAKNPAPAACALGGFVLHSLSLGWEWVGQSQIQISGPSQILSFMAWCAVLLFLIGYHLFKKPAALTSFFMPVVVVLAVVAEAIHVVPPQPDADRSGWWMVHGVMMLLGYGAFAVACVTGVMYLVQEHHLKAKITGKLFQRLPSLAALERMNVLAIGFGFTLYTVSLIAAAVGLGAKSSSPVEWVSTPLGVVTVLTWILYLIAVNVRFLAALRGKKIAFITIMGFVLVLFTLGIIFSVDNVHAMGVVAGGPQP